MGKEPMSASEAGKTEKRKMSAKEKKAYEEAVAVLPKMTAQFNTAILKLENLAHPQCEKLLAQLTRKRDGLHKFWYKRSPDVREERDRRSKAKKIERLKKRMAELEAELKDE